MKKKNVLFKKNIVGMLVAAVFVGSLAGCGDNSSLSGASNGGSNEVQTNEAETTEVETIKLSTAGMPAPYTYVDENNEVVGYDIDLARAVFERLPQYKLEIILAEVTAVLSNLDADIAQISANQWVKTEEREEKYLFSNPILDMRYVALFQTGSEHPDRIETLADLGGLSTIGAPTNNTITVLENYNQANPDDPVIINYSEEDNAKMYQDVQEGLYDFVLNNKVSYYYQQKTYGTNLDVVELSDEAVAEIMNGEPYSFIIIEAGREDLQADINAALAEVVTDGTARELSEKYFGEDCAPYNAY